MKNRILVILFFMVSYTMFSQDVIYTTTGNKYKAKVVEINTYEVKYKDFENPDGPTYVLSKSEVVLINYQNGTVEVVNPNPPNYSPNKTETYATKKPEKANPNALYYAGKNFLSLNALALMNGDVALFYDRDLLENKLGITAMGSYNFNDSKPFFNSLFNLAYPNAKKQFDAGLGINFFPSDRGRAQYFVGLLGKYMQMKYDKTEVSEVEINGFVFQKNTIVRASSSQVMVGVTNGLLIRVSPQFNCKLFATVGLAGNSPAPASKEYASYPKLYFGYCFGYRF